MSNLKLFFSLSLFIIFLIITSIVKNQSRILEKKILGLKSTIISKKNDLSEAQLEFFYLTSPRIIEKKIGSKDIKKFEPIKHSKIFNNLSEFIKVEKKLSDLRNRDEKKISKK